MSDSTIDLQFDRAQFDGTGQRTPCAMCKQPLASAYFEVNGLTMCATCCQALRAHLDAGTPASRAFRAAVAGFGAAVAGTILYYGILAISGYQLGLIAIVVGFMVGKAVRWGSYGRGGWKYQAMAMALTYLSIVGSYVPFIVQGISNQAKKAAAAAPTSGQTTEPAVQRADRSTPAPANPAAAPAKARPTLLTAVVGLVVLVLFVCAIPFLMGVRNIMGLIIIGIGLYEAWKFNRRRVVVITGPHALATSAAAPATA